MKKASGISIVLIILISYLTLGIVFSGGWLPGFAHRKQFTVGALAGAPANYQLNLTVYNTTGTDLGNSVYLGSNCQADFDDVRITKSDGYTLIDTGKENSSTTSTSTRVWAELPDALSSGAQTYYLYYGNPAAASVYNMNATMDFYDDFDGATVNATNYYLPLAVAPYATATVGSSYLKCDPSRLESLCSFGVNYSLIMYSDVVDSASDNVFGWRNSSNAYVSSFRTAGTSGETIVWSVGYTHRVWIENDNLIRTEIVRNAAASVSFWENTTLITTYLPNATFPMPTDNANVGVTLDSTDQIWIDWWAVRKYNSGDAVITSWGSEGSLINKFGSTPIIMLESQPEVTPTTIGSRQTVNVSAYVPSTATGIILEVQNTGTGAYLFDVRRYGATDEDYENSFGTLQALCHETAISAITSGSVSVAISNAAVHIYLIGYFTDSAGWLAARQDISTGTINTWMDTDVSAYVEANATAAIVKVRNGEVSSKNALLRINGGTDNLNTGGKVVAYGFIWAIVPLDTGLIFEQNISDTDEDLFLLGWLRCYPESVQYLTNTVKLTLNSTSAWEQVYLPDYKPGVVILDIHNIHASTSYICNAQQNASEVPTTYSKVYFGTHTTLITPCVNWTFQIYRDSTNIEVYLIGMVEDTLISNLLYLANDRLNKTDYWSNYVAWMFGKNTTNAVEAPITYYGNKSLTSGEYWREALMWSTEMAKYGYKDWYAINASLNAATMSLQGDIFPNSTDSAAESPSMWRPMDKYALYGYLWAIDYGNNLTKWNYTNAWINYTATLAKVDVLADNKALYAVANSVAGYSTGSRFYDEFSSSVLSCLLFYSLFNITDALAEAQLIFDTVVDANWEINAVIGDHFNYRNDIEWAHTYETEGCFFLQDIAMLKYYNFSMVDWDKVLTDFQNRYIANKWYSAQWRDANNPQPSTFASVHLFAHATGGYWGTDQRRMGNTLGAWQTILALSQMVNSTYQQDILDMLKGYGTYQPAWKLLFSNQTYLWNATAQMFHLTSDPSEAATSPSDEGTADATALLFYQGMLPYGGTIAMPLSDLTYEDKFTSIDHDLFAMDFDSNSIKVAVYNGTIGFQYGTSEVNCTFPSNGVYNVTFGADWNSIVGTPSKLSELPSTRIFLKEITSTTAGLSQLISAVWATGIQHGFLTGLSQLINGAWASGIQQSFLVGLVQSISSVWSVLTGWVANIGLSQSLTSSWATTIHWVAQTSLSQSITSAWSISAISIFNVALTQSVSASWATLTKWVASIALSDSIATVWSPSTKWVALIGLSQSLTTVWSGLAKWATNVALSQSISSLWSIASGLGFYVGLSQSINAVWSILVRWTLNVNLSQSLSAVWSISSVLSHMGTWTADLSQTISIVWSIVTHWIANIGLSYSLTSIWSVLIVWTAHLNLSQAIFGSWNLATQWFANANLSQGITGNWGILNHWVASIDLSTATKTIWNILAKWSRIVSLTQTIATDWTILTGWNAHINLSQGMMATWNMLTQMDYNIGLTFSSGITWSVNAFLVAAHHLIANLNLGILMIWTISLGWMTSGGVSNFWKILALFLMLMLAVCGVFLVDEESKKKRKREITQ